MPDDDGRIMAEVDYSQLEIRIAAEAMQEHRAVAVAVETRQVLDRLVAAGRITEGARDRRMAQVLGEDIHDRIQQDIESQRRQTGFAELDRLASQGLQPGELVMFGGRRHGLSRASAMALSFGAIYGQGPDSLRTMLGVDPGAGSSEASVVVLKQREGKQWVAGDVGFGCDRTSNFGWQRKAPWPKQPNIRNAWERLGEVF